MLFENKTKENERDVDLAIKNLNKDTMQGFIYILHLGFLTTISVTRTYTYYVPSNDSINMNTPTAWDTAYCSHAEADVSDMRSVS
jgi:hypothetical protein